MSEIVIVAVRPSYGNTEVVYYKNKNSYNLLKSRGLSDKDMIQSSGFFIRSVGVK